MFTCAPKNQVLANRQAPHDLTRTMSYRDFLETLLHAAILMYGMNPPYKTGCRSGPAAALDTLLQQHREALEGISDNQSTFYKSKPIILII